MKNIYLVVFTLLISISISFGQSRIYAPNLQLPADGAVDQMPAVVLNWHAVAGSGFDIQYEVQLSVDDAFSNPIEFPLTTVTAISASELNFGNTYYWRVRAHDGDDVSDWSEVWSFAVIKTVEVISPKDGGTVNPQVEMKWDMIDGVDFYEVLVDTLYSWKSEDVGTDHSIRSTFVIDENNYGGVGDNGLVFNYNGQWNIGESGTTKDLLGVYFVDAANGWAVGKEGTVIHFDGTAWGEVNAGVKKDLYAVSFVDANNGWAVGKSGTVLYYNGTDWATQDAGVTKDLYSVFTVSANDVWIGGKTGTVVHYDGSTWTTVDGLTKDVLCFWFNSANDGWASEKSGRIAHYDGNEWTEATTNVAKSLYGIAFSGAQGYAVGASGTLLEYDGVEWNKVTSGTDKDLYAIWFANNTGLYGGKTGVAFTYTGGGFNSPYATTYKVDGTLDSLYLQNSLFGVTYYYKIRTGHSKDTSFWSLPRSFKVQSSPVLKSPKDDASDIELKVDLKWKEFKGVLVYNIEVADNPEFTGAYNYSSENTTYSITGLSFGTKYYWRVRAQHADAISLWSDVWSFNTLNSVVLLAPENEAVDINPCPLMQWEEIPGASRYEIWLDTDENFPNPKSRVETNSSIQCDAQLEKGTDYYWKVRGIVALDTSDWSPTWKFTTEKASNIKEVQVASIVLYPNPSNGQFSILFNSRSKNDLNIQVSDNSGKVVYNKVVAVSIGDNSIMVNLDGLATGTYYISLKNDKTLISRRLLIE